MNALMTMPTGYAPAVETRSLNPSVNAWLGRARTVAMLVAAPLIGLAYAIAFPFIGLAMLVWIGFRAMPRKLKNVVLFFAAPFVGLAYAIVFPVVGLGMIAWIGLHALAK